METEKGMHLFFVVHVILCYELCGTAGQAVPVHVQSSVPSRIPRVRAFLTGLIQGNSRYYSLRVTWTEPYYWNDEGDGSDQGYNLNCFQELSGRKGQNMVDINVAYDFQGYSEKFLFPAPDMDLYVQCAVRPRNSKNVFGDWTFAQKIRVSDVPVYMVGFEGIDVRGFSQADIEALRARIAAAGQNQ